MKTDICTCLMRKSGKPPYSVWGATQWVWPPNTSRGVRARVLS